MPHVETLCLRIHVKSSDERARLLAVVKAESVIQDRRQYPLFKHGTDNSNLVVRPWRMIHVNPVLDECSKVRRQLARLAYDRVAPKRTNRCEPI